MGLCTTFMVVALLLMTTTRADVWPGQAGYDAICQEIIDDTEANIIPFRRLVRSCSGWWGWRCRNKLETRETLSRLRLCNRLVQQHNTYNSAFLSGANVSSFQCLTAFSSPALYGVAQWNNWAGRHCGTWTNTAGSGAFDDEAYWNTAVPSPNIGYHRQAVTFDRPGTCCDSGWNESGGSVSPSTANIMSPFSTSILLIL